MTNIQPNDILRITVGALAEGSALPYNRVTNQVAGNNNIEMLKLEGYLVLENNTIDFPQLGTISTEKLTVSQLELEIKKQLEEGNHLNNPSVNVRIINAKVTVLGEVTSPGTIAFTEQNITLLQAIGYAGDLTINGKREDVKIIREVDGNRKIGTIDLTSAELFNSEYYFVKPNDVIVVNPNGPKVKSSGYIGNIGTALTVLSIVLTSIVLLTR
ncbi:MAG: polysaccharide biosynthesis/export family protein [Psychroserpens sp.]|uniref:polysaccharide biosynthesis/export family protein n=1 Tax=Psychroserpens sp. TaxID=2020870 RepID=UPI003C80A81C